MHDVLKKYNLPKEVKFCTKCVVSNQRPRITFDEEGVCSACRFAEHKKTGIDWDKRRHELQELCNKHRKNDGSYDVVVPSSGGKDSNLVAHMLKHEFGMHPLAVTWSPFLYTDIGFENLQSFIGSGFDNILYSPNRQVHRELTKIAFEQMGDHFQPFIFGQYTIPFRVALQNDISLVFYGEDGEVEYGGDSSMADRPSLPFNDFVKHRFSGVFADKFKEWGIDERKLKNYMLSDKEMEIIEKKDIRQYFFSYFRKWLPQENFYYAQEHTGFKANPDGRSEGTYSKYASLDDKTDGYHYYLAFIKFGIGRATSDASHEIRDGHITREEGVSLVKRFDGEFPKKYFQEFLEYCDISQDRFEKIIDSWRSPHLWKKENGKWQLLHQVS
jgi:N-acetyl sugar amidotransferase